MSENDDNKPRRRVEAVIRIGADSIDDLVKGIYQIAGDVEAGSREIASGSPSVGWTVEVTEDETITHESYFDALLEHLGKQRKTPGPVGDIEKRS
jgi:hypothetical protein